MMRRQPFHRVLPAVFGSTVFIQILGFLRHTVIAAYFGISRDFDLYTLVLAIATMVIFTFANIFDNVAVPRLTRLHAEGDRAGFITLSNRIFTFAWLMTIALSALFWVGLPLIVPLAAAGLNASEQQQLVALAPFFLPWTIFSVPYYSVCSFYKAQWRFQRVLGTEALIMVGSLATLIAWHDSIEALPLAYGAGYGLGLIWLLFGSGLRFRLPSPKASGMRDFLRNLVELFFANQVGSLAGFLEKFLQSFLAPGSIAAYSYAGLIVGNTSALLSFREIFIVPLSEENGREAKLERLIIALSLLALPMAGFFAVEARFILKVLLQRGQFDAQAVAISGQVLAIACWGLWPGMINAPMMRLFQILDCIRATGWLYLVGLATTAILGGLLIFVLDLGLTGFAISAVASSYAIAIAAALMLRRFGVAPSWWRIGKYCACALLASAAGAGIVALLPELGNPWVDGFLSCTVYWLPIAALYGLLHRRLRLVLGMEGPKS